MNSDPESDIKTRNSSPSDWDKKYKSIKIHTGEKYSRIYDELTKPSLISLIEKILFLVLKRS